MAGYIGKSQGKILTNVEGNSVETADIQDSAVTETKIAAGSVTDSKLNSTKLDGIEAGATADQTGAEIKAAYEGEANTNAYTDAEKTKLSGIEAGADVTDTTNVTAAGALMDSEVTNLAAVKAFDPTDYATAAQGALADSAVQPSDNISGLTNDSGYITGVSVSGISDTTITTPADNEVLAYDSTTSKWINQTAAEAGLQPAGSYLTGNQTITLSGDVSGSGTTSISVTVADDSHNHVISNVDGLQTALDSKQATGDYVVATGDTMTGALNFGDNVKAQFGASNDLQMYHTGTQSIISDTGTGNLNLEGSDRVVLRNSGGTENYLQAINNGAVTLYYNNSVKLATTSTGVSVTGTVAATSFTGDGSSLTGIQSYTKSASDPAATSNKALGDLWVNYTTGETYVCTDATTNDNQWINVGEGDGNINTFTATGGTVSTSGGYTYHTFTSSSSFTTTKAKSMDILIIAGGGGGGGVGVNGGGGGGAGGYVAYSGHNLAAGTYTVTVGGAGTAGASGGNGGNSSVTGLTTAIGGGGGGGNTNNVAGQAGGSGGGAGRDRGTMYGSGTSGQGNRGGAAGGTSCSSGGGGGGAGSVGYAGEYDCGSGYSNANSSRGGDGLTWVDGVTRAGGGGGGYENNRGGYGGTGGGGQGGSTGVSSGSTNTGGGGGGSAYPNTGSAGNGGSGIVIIRYAV